MPDGITKMICRSRRRARCDGCACLAEQHWARTAKIWLQGAGPPAHRRAGPLAYRDEERRLLRNVFAGKPLDKRRQDGGLGVGHREPVHARAACVRDVESAYGA